MPNSEQNAEECDATKLIVVMQFGNKKRNPIVETTGCKPKPTAYEKILEFVVPKSGTPN
jgi:hypothetical protein